jgi:hypothetical protein
MDRSQNRLMYDKCAYNEDLTQSVSPLAYMLDKSRFENVNKCRIPLGVVGGTAVSHVDGNLVDLENNLFGLDRPETLCSAYKFIPTKDGQPLQGKEYIKPVCHPNINTQMKHLPTCQMQSFHGINMPEPIKPFQCSPQMQKQMQSGFP